MANTIEIVIKGTNQAGKPIAEVKTSLGGLGNAAKSSTGLLGSLASGLGGVATVAAGIVTANLFGAIASGLSSIVSTGLEAVGSQQQLETSLKSLLTANNMYATSTETVTQAVVKEIMSQDEMSVATDELTAKLATQRATFQEQSERIRQLTAAWGENGLAVITARAKHDELALSIQETERKLAGLTTTETEYITSTKTSISQVMNQADAFELAKKQTEDLLDFVTRLAVVSPFETETVEQTTKYAIAAGLGVDATKEFVPAFLDLAAAVGITSDGLGFAADQLFQVKKIGKLTEIDLRQLRRVGIDLAKVIGVEMGMSVEEFNAQAEKSPEIFDELFAAVTRFSENTFSGTAGEMATSVKGLMSTINDVFVIGSRTFMRPLVDAVTPAISEIISKISDFVLGGDLAGIGQEIADSVTVGLEQGWPGIQSELVAWGSRFWNWVETTAIPRGQAAFTALVDWISAQITEHWPGIAATLGTWGTQFWDWLTLTALPLAGRNLDLLAFGFAGLVVKKWDIIRPELEKWGTQFWDWLTLTALPLASEKLAELTTAVSQFLAEQWTNTIQPALTLWGTQFWDWLTLTALPLASEKLAEITTAISQFLAEQWTNSIKPELDKWSVQFFDWVAIAYADIPTNLTKLTTGIADFLREQGPTIQAVGESWPPLFWEWVNKAIDSLGETLGSLLVAIIAWATSQEAQTELQNIGNSIGQSIVTNLSNSFENSAEIAKVLGKLALGLLAAVVGIATVLATVGVNIVTGILDGILEAIGVDLEPATATELNEVFGGIGTNLRTIVLKVGSDLIQGIIDGIASMQQSLEDSLFNLAMGAIDSFKSVFGIASPSSIFFDFGVNLIQGLLDGIGSLAGEVAAKIGELLGSLFGGEDTGLAFEPATMLAELEKVNAFFLETLPASITTMGTSFSTWILTATTEITNLGLTFTLFITTATTEITTLIAGPLAQLILTISNIYLIYLPLLVSTWITSTAQIISQIMLTSDSLTALIAVISSTQAAAVAMAEAIVAGMEDAAESFGEAADKIKETLVPAIEKATTAFEKMEAAAKRAAEAARSAGSASSNAGSTGFQHGTGPSGFTVPSGFPNDSFKIGLSSGEHFEVTPKGGSSQKSTTNNYYFSQTVNTSATSSTVIGDFNVMRSLIGA